MGGSLNPPRRCWQQVNRVKGKSVDFLPCGLTQEPAPVAWCFWVPYSKAMFDSPGENTSPGARIQHIGIPFLQKTLVVLLT